MMEYLVPVFHATSIPIDGSSKPCLGRRFPSRAILASLMGIHPAFIARCYRRECPAAAPERLHNNLRNTMVAGFILGDPRKPWPRSGGARGTGPGLSASGGNSSGIHYPGAGYELGPVPRCGPLTTITLFPTLGTGRLGWRSARHWWRFIGDSSYGTTVDSTRRPAHVSTQAVAGRRAFVSSHPRGSRGGACRACNSVDCSANG